MEVKQAVSRLIAGLEQQEYYFSDEIKSGMFVENYEYFSGAKKKIAKLVAKFNASTVTYGDWTKDEFDKALVEMNENLDDRMLLTWGFKSGSFTMIGIIFADNINESDLKAIFSKLDAEVLKMRKFSGKGVQGNKLGTYATFMPVFGDSAKARSFNANIKKFYESHMLKGAYTSTISFDCADESVTVGKAALGLKWSGGIAVKELCEAMGFSK